MPTLNIALANGEEGYIPPPEQHVLGGYSTWEARTAGLEEEAEPKIVEAVLELLEQVSGKPRRKFAQTHGSYAQAVLASGPVAYWRMAEPNGPTAIDCAGRENHGRYEGGVAFFLEGPSSPGFRTQGGVNRAAHYAGGRMQAAIEGLGPTYSVETWIYNGMPGDARPVAGYFFSRTAEATPDAGGDHLGIGGTAAMADRLVFASDNGRSQPLMGRNRLALKTWYHVTLVREGPKVTVYLNGNPRPEIHGHVATSALRGLGHLFVGGRGDESSDFAGKIDEVAIYDRALAPDEVAQHYAVADHGP